MFQDFLLKPRVLTSIRLYAAGGLQEYRAGANEAVRSEGLGLAFCLRFLRVFTVKPMLTGSICEAYQGVIPELDCPNVSAER
jgi:hypothetical protein